MQISIQHEYIGEVSEQWKHVSEADNSTIHKVLEKKNHNGHK
jgi:hypothetical protein